MSAIDQTLEDSAATSIWGILSWVLYVGYVIGLYNYAQEGYSWFVLAAMCLPFAFHGVLSEYPSLRNDFQAFNFVGTVIKAVAYSLWMVGVAVVICAVGVLSPSAKAIGSVPISDEGAGTAFAIFCITAIVGGLCAARQALKGEDALKQRAILAFDILDTAPFIHPVDDLDKDTMQVAIGENISIVETAPVDAASPFISYHPEFARDNPRDPEKFAVSLDDAIASEQDIVDVEDRLGVLFPKDWADLYLMQNGGLMGWVLLESGGDWIPVYGEILPLEMLISLDDWCPDVPRAICPNREKTIVIGGSEYAVIVLDAVTGDTMLLMSNEEEGINCPIAWQSWQDMCASLHREIS